MSGDFHPPVPKWDTAADVLAYLASRGETVEKHEHIWVHWDAWDDWNWRPHRGRRLLVCDVPDCFSMLSVPVDER